MDRREHASEVVVGAYLQGPRKPFLPALDCLKPQFFKGQQASLLSGAGSCYGEVEGVWWALVWCGGAQVWCGRGEWSEVESALVRLQIGR